MVGKPMDDLEAGWIDAQKSVDNYWTAEIMRKAAAGNKHCQQFLQQDEISKRNELAARMPDEKFAQWVKTPEPDDDRIQDIKESFEAMQKVREAAEEKRDEIVGGGPEETHKRRAQEMSKPTPSVAEITAEMLDWTEEARMLSSDEPPFGIESRQTWIDRRIRAIIQMMAQLDDYDQLPGVELARELLEHLESR